MNIPFKEGNILIPKNIDMTKWSVVACDQYTSEPDYWQEVKDIVKDTPSTLNLTLPEIYLEEKDVDEKIHKINDTMDDLLAKDFFYEYKDAMIYLERTQNDGLVREGLIGLIDLEAYSYEIGDESLIRGTEKTVIERVPPRVKIRKNASLELPHIMVLIDDDKKEIIESLKNEATKKDIIYDFNLMKNGGHVKGYLLNKNTIKNVKTKLETLADPKNFQKKYNIKNKNVLLFAMGDGNHSLTAAKVCYENLKKSMKEEEYLNHPSRYALVELVNLHSDALTFESINRVVFNTNPKDLLDKLKKYYNLNKDGIGQEITIITKNSDETWYISNPKSNIAVGSIQIFLDEYLENNPGKIDYIHGTKATKDLVSKSENNIGFIFNPIKKEELFKTVILDGTLPRKTFAMGHSYDKRYYLEARKIN